MRLNRKVAEESSVRIYLHLMTLDHSKESIATHDVISVSFTFLLTLFELRITRYETDNEQCGSHVAAATHDLSL